ncbi:hypothetical protein TNIN_187191 [Trichonephila inaurata madagascariensis]|uniref:Uncharacterized protein n=1 Tax=Trichonephila inaurata madagascariensis TaxID=2747483 RepID=A0A8X6MB50_9ARAC|nr:hypothetical protein TNIN_187191 [Trichonephila inaurata madagascariensis]
MTTVNDVEIETQQIEKQAIIENESSQIKDVSIVNIKTENLQNKKDTNIVRVKNENLIVEEDIKIVKIKSENVLDKEDVNIVSKNETLLIEVDVNKIENPEMVGNAEALFIKNDDSQIENKIPVIEAAENITCGDGDAHKKNQVEVKIADVDFENKNVCKEENRIITFTPVSESRNYRLCEFEMSSDSENSSDSSSDSDSDSFFNELHKRLVTFCLILFLKWKIKELMIHIVCKGIKNISCS